MWAAVIEFLSDQETLSQQRRAFLRLTSLLAIIEDTALLAVPDAYTRDQIETQLRGHITEALTRHLGRSMQVAVTIRPPEEAEQLDRLNAPMAAVAMVPVPRSATTRAPAEPEPSRASRAAATHVPTHYREDRPRPVGDAGNGLNPAYTFASFVVGASNRFAHAAAIAVAETPGTAYNPLFIYGDRALGTDHLLHAIGNYALSLGTVKRVRCATAEEFTSDFINSVRDETYSDFRRRYRDDIDMLLLGDVQFLENRERTQEELFDTFNALHNANKQIVITCDRKARDLRLPDRLRTRFEWGLVADIHPADLETRIAILHKMRVRQRLQVPNEVLELVASRITLSVRDLEAALLRVVAFANVTRSVVDVAVAEEALRDFIPDGTAGELTVEQIMEAVSEYYGVSVNDLRRQSRSRTLAEARQIAMYLCRELTDMSLPRIGQAFGGRDHITVMHAERKIRQLMSERRTLYNQIVELTNRIKSA